MKAKDLSTIMRRAWQIVRATGKAMSIALVKAWELYRLAQRMRNSAVRFAYEKKDGTLRHAVGTLQNVAALVKGIGSTDNGQTFKYYDTQAEAFRCFKVENFITAY